MDSPLIAISHPSLAYIFDRVPSSALLNQVDPLNSAATEAQINTPDRWSMWLAQLGVESAQLSRFEEGLNYSAQALLATWPRRFSPADAQAYQHQPERIANRAYALRNGNGDEASGEGYRYRGRGAIQLTGRGNYLAAGRALSLDLVGHPELAASDARFRVASWFWISNGLNHWADGRDIEGATKAINGPAMKGLVDRKALFTRAQEILSAPLI